MTKTPFTMLRALGILVGLLFVGTAPFIAKDAGFTSLDGVSSLVVSTTLGLVFIGYGITGISQMRDLPPALRTLVSVVLIGFQLSIGLYLLTAQHRHIASRLVGALLLVFAAVSIYTAYTKRRSTPAE